MSPEFARHLLCSLLERLEDDARADSPRFRGLIGAAEREALKILLRQETLTSEIESTRAHPATDPLPETSSTAVAAPIADTHPSVEQQRAASTAPSSDEQFEIGTVNLSPSLAAVRPALVVNDTAWSRLPEKNETHVLCIDFGTAKSKALAASLDPDPDDVELIDLALGRLDNDLDGAVYTVASSVWIADNGLLYAGSEAVRKSMQAGVLSNQNRRRLDSVKQQLTLLTVEQDLESFKLEPEINPTSTALSYEDAICFFLAYLTDLAATELERRGHPRYMRRRFTIPAWKPSQRAWAAPLLARLLARAQVLADTFHGKWQSGVAAEDLKSVMSIARQHESELLYLLADHKAEAVTLPQGVLEPLAAGSGRILADRHARNLVLVVDVGAGTTDYSLFWAVQGQKGQKAFPIQPGSGAIKIAGDKLDDILIAELLSRADTASDEWLKKRFEAELRLMGIRRMKETLFQTGRLDVTVADHSASIELPEFLAHERVKRFANQIEDAIRKFLAGVDPSWRKADHALLVLTGGGSNLPMIRNLANMLWDLGGRHMKFVPAQALPELIEEFDTDFQQEYAQLAVAIGGALPVLDESMALLEFAGAAGAPVSLERYQVTGT